MKTWNDYKEYAKAVNPESKKGIEEIEVLAAIAGTMIEQYKTPVIVKSTLDFLSIVKGKR